MLLQTLSTESNQSIFVTPFLESSTTYYKSESLRLSSSLSSSSYLAKVHERLTEESERCELVLGSNLRVEVEKIVLDSMVVGVVDGIATKEAGGWIQEEKKTELSGIFSLLQKVDNLMVLRDAFREFVKVSRPLLPFVLVANFLESSLQV